MELFEQFLKFVVLRCSTSICSVFERNAEVLARSLLIGVTLGWRGEVLQQEQLASLKQKNNEFIVKYHMHSIVCFDRIDGVVW